MKALFLMIAALMASLAPASADSFLKLEGDNRVINVYARNEIPDYLRSGQCSAYAYEQKFENFVYLDLGKVTPPPNAGTTAGDIRILKDRNICMLRLRQESRLKGTNKPVNIYEIDMLGRGTNELRVGQNHRSMPDGDYTFESGARLTVKDNRILSAPSR